MPNTPASPIPSCCGKARSFCIRALPPTSPQVAQSSGYLDALYTNTLIGLR